MDFLRVAVELASPVHGASVGVNVGERNGVGGEACVESLELFRGIDPELNESKGRNPRVNGSTGTGARASMVMRREWDSSCVLAGANPPTVSRLGNVVLSDAMASLPTFYVEERSPVQVGGASENYRSGACNWNPLCFCGIHILRNWSLASPLSS